MNSIFKLIVKNPSLGRNAIALVGISFFSPRLSPSNYGESLELEDMNNIDFNTFMDKPITDQDRIIGEKNFMRRRMEVFIMKVQRNVFKKLIEIEEKEAAEIATSSQASHYEQQNDIPSDVNDMITIDRWTRNEGGGGITCIIQNGRVFEKAGVNISVVYGTLPQSAIVHMKARNHQFSSLIKNSNEVKFFAAGVSSVIHPRNPNVPTIHFNYRYFEIENPDPSSAGVHAPESIWWFGGGTDLTPYLLDESDCKCFHQELKNACDKHDSSYYSRFKQWCDEYFYIVHRNERRGVGGLFFDDVDYPDQERAFSFIRSCAHHILPSYIPIVLKNMHKTFSERDREWQLLRRGRYVEFNLVYDRGTKFGLSTPGARYESILMSLPLFAKWLHCHEPEEGSNYAKLMEVLKKPRKWA